MERYRVVFEVKFNGENEWIKDGYSYGGRGLSIEEACEIKNNIEQYGIDGAIVRNVRIEEI